MNLRHNDRKIRVRGQLNYLKQGHSAKILKLYKQRGTARAALLKVEVVEEAKIEEVTDGVKV